MERGDTTEEVVTLLLRENKRLKGDLTEAESTIRNLQNDLKANERAACAPIKVEDEEKPTVKQLAQVVTLEKQLVEAGTRITELQASHREVKQLRRELRDRNKSSSAVQQSFDTLRAEHDALLGRLATAREAHEAVSKRNDQDIQDLKAQQCTLERELQEAITRARDSERELQQARHTTKIVDIPGYMKRASIVKEDPFPSRADILSAPQGGDEFFREHALRGVSTTPNKIVCFHEGNTLWAKNGILHCVVVQPAQIWTHGRSESGAWHNPSFGVRPGDRRLLYVRNQDSRKFKYLGTYHVVDLGVSKLERLKEMSKHVSSAIVKQTAVPADLVTPFMTRIVQEMYRDGVCLVQVCALKRVGFDNSLAVVRSSADAAAKTADRKPVTIQIPGSTPSHSNASKRKTATGDDVPRQYKRRKT